MSRRPLLPPLKCTFEQVYAALEALPQRRVTNLTTTGGVVFDATASITQDGRAFINLPHNNRIYRDDWGFASNQMGQNGQRIGQYARPLDDWCASLTYNLENSKSMPRNIILDTIESYRTVHIESRPAVIDLRSSARSRLIWFVGISGYALLNARPYWEALGQRQFSSLSLVWLSLPWILSAFFSVMTHFLIDEVGARDNLYFISKLAAIDLHRSDVTAGLGQSDEFLQILNDTHPNIHSVKLSVDRWAFLTKWAERLAFTSLVAGFIWAAVGPFVIR